MKVLCCVARLLSPSIKIYPYVILNSPKSLIHVHSRALLPSCDDDFCLKTVHLFYNKYTRWRAVAVPSCPVAAHLLLPARCPFQGHTDRWGKVSLPNQARRRWHKFSVASNRKTNLILETRTLLSLSLSGGLNRRERRRFQFGCSTDCSSFLHMITQRPRRRSPGRTTWRWHRFFGKEGSLWGWGHTFDVVLVFCFPWCTSR